MPLTQILRYETHIVVVLCSPERMHSLTVQYALIHRYLQTVPSSVVCLISSNIFIIVLIVFLSSVFSWFFLSAYCSIRTLYSIKRKGYVVTLRFPNSQSVSVIYGISKHSHNSFRFKFIIPELGFWWVCLVFVIRFFNLFQYLFAIFLNHRCQKCCTSFHIKNGLSVKFIVPGLGFIKTCASSWCAISISICNL